MGFDSDQVSTVTFDSYSTLVDVGAVEKALAAHVDDPQPVSKLWRARSLDYTFVANAIGAYQPFYEMNRDALHYALDVDGVDISTSERDETLAVYHEFDVFADARDDIERFRDREYDCFVVSNGDPEMPESMTDHAGIGDIIEDTISADKLRTFKPAAEIYRHAAAHRNTDRRNRPCDCWLVRRHWRTTRRDAGRLGESKINTVGALRSRPRSHHRDVLRAG